MFKIHTLGLCDVAIRSQDGKISINLIKLSPLYTYLLSLAVVGPHYHKIVTVTTASRHSHWLAVLGPRYHKTVQ